MVAEALIGAAGSILGGLFGRSKSQTPWQQMMSHVQGVMDAAGTHNINPLLLLQSGVSFPYQQGSNASLGAGISDAFAQFGQLVGNRKAQSLDRLQRQNEYLARRVGQLSLSPRVPGVYQQRQASGGSSNAAPSRQAVGAVSGSGFAGAGGSVVLDAVAPSETNVFRRHFSRGEHTDVPVGPDIDEVVSGFFIDAMNRHEAAERYRANHTVGQPFKLTSVWDYPSAHGIGARAVRKSALGSLSSHWQSVTAKPMPKGWFLPVSPVISP